MSELRIVPRKYLPSIEFVLSASLPEPVVPVPCPSSSRRHLPLQPRKSIDFMKTIDTRFSGRRPSIPSLPRMSLKHRRSSSANSNESRAYYADSSDIETICDSLDESESGPSRYSLNVEDGVEEEEPEWQYEIELGSVPGFDEEWWGDIEDELEEDRELYFSYGGSETDSVTVVEDPAPLHPHTLSFIQRLLWRITKRSSPCTCKACSSRMLTHATSKSSLTQAKQVPSPVKTSRIFWNLK